MSRPAHGSLPSFLFPFLFKRKEEGKEPPTTLHQKEKGKRKYKLIINL
jgi:hypothetical protein